MRLEIITQSSLEDALLFELFAYAQENSNRAQSSVLKSRMGTNISLMRIEMALDELVTKEMAEMSYDTFGEDPTTYAVTRTGYLKVEEALSDEASFFSVYATEGIEALKRQTIDAVPASNRIVLRSDNEDAISQIERGIKDLELEVGKSNSIEEVLDEPKDVVLTDLNAGKAITKSERFRLSSLVGVLIPLLKKLADKFASGAIGKLASELIEALLKLN